MFMSFIVPPLAPVLTMLTGIIGVRLKCLPSLSGERASKGVPALNCGLKGDSHAWYVESTVKKTATIEIPIGIQNLASIAVAHYNCFII